MFGRYRAATSLHGAHPHKNESLVIENRIGLPCCCDEGELVFYTKFFTRKPSPHRTRTEGMDMKTIKIGISQDTFDRINNDFDDIMKMTDEYELCERDEQRARTRRA